MANYYATTTSNGGKINKRDHAKIQTIIDKYNFDSGDDCLSIELGEEINIYGYTSPYAYKKEDEDYDEEVFDEFLQELAPFIKTPLIISEVGSEKCRYVCAYAYVVKPNEKVVSVSLDDAINRILELK
tara:strand:- start:6957 stop:7340 length:384 start_codon:yes stop_codon:yes gene_type:complete